MMQFFENGYLGLCWWDAPVLILLAAATALFLVKRSKLNREKKELESRLTK